MFLFRHGDDGKLVVVAEKGIYRNAKIDMENRGFIYQGAFNASWGAFTKEFTQLSTGKEYDKFIKAQKPTEAYRGKPLRSGISVPF